jgi:predicted kinase
MQPSRPRVVMMCGLSGSGKTTYARQLETEGFARLSIDEEIFARYGRYGIDYPADNWVQYQAEAELALKERLGELVRAGRNVVVDFSFWNRAFRDEWKHLIDVAGGAWELVFIKVDPAALPGRLAGRRDDADANAFPVMPEMLAFFIEGFEFPDGEGEIVVET